ARAGREPGYSGVQALVDHAGCRVTRIDSREEDPRIRGTHDESRDPGLRRETRVAGDPVDASIRAHEYARLNGAGVQSLGGNRVDRERFDPLGETRARPRRPGIRALEDAGAVGYVDNARIGR